jgi:hypothetical protein
MHPYWAANGDDAQWITPNGEVGTVASGTWVYSTTFTLASNEVSTTTLGGWWTSDNNATMYLNGTSTGNTIGRDGSNQLHDFYISTGFQEGLNTLTFEVYNIVQGSDSNPNGLYVAIPEPASMAMIGIVTSLAFFIRKKFLI